MRYCLILLLFVTLFTHAKSVNDEQAIELVLDGFHQAAANAQMQRYFNYMTDDAIFLGTDANERWTKTEFKHYAAPYFSRGKGWLYIAKQRNISLISNQKVAFFDELLNNAIYGLCRGTGIMIKTAQGWKISQYNLSLPLPNGMVKGVARQIKQFKDNTLQKSTLKVNTLKENKYDEHNK